MPAVRIREPSRPVGTAAPLRRGGAPRYAPDLILDVRAGKSSGTTRFDQMWTITEETVMGMHNPPHLRGIVKRQRLEPLGLAVTRAVRRSGGTATRPAHRRRASRPATTAAGRTGRPRCRRMRPVCRSSRGAASCPCIARGRIRAVPRLPPRFQPRRTGLELDSVKRRRLDSPPNAAGSRPVRRLSERSGVSRLARLPRAPGILPVNMFPRRSRSLRWEMVWVPKLIASS